MGRKAHTTAAEIERGWLRPQKKVVTRTLFAAGLLAMTGLGITRGSGSGQDELAVMRSAPDSTSTSTSNLPLTTTGEISTTTTTSVDTYNPRIPEAPEKQEIIRQLGEYGLGLVPDPQGINYPHQFFTTADGECAVQHGVVELPDGRINVSAYFFGPEWALTDSKIIDLDGTGRAYTAHAESTLDIGEVFPGGTGSELRDAMTYIAETTRFLCDNFVPPAVIAAQIPE